MDVSARRDPWATGTPGGEAARTIFRSATASASVVGAQASVDAFRASRSGEGGGVGGMWVKPPFVGERHGAAGAAR